MTTSEHELTEVSLTADDLRDLEEAAHHEVDLGVRPGSRTAELIETLTRLTAARHAVDVQEVVKRAARNLVRADGAAFVLRDGDMCHYVDEDAIGPLWKGRRFPLETCVSGWAMTHRESVSIPDVFADPRVPVDAYRPTFVRSLHMTPIGREEPVGAIGVYWATSYTPTAAQQTLLQALADSTVVALETAARWQQQEDELASLRAQLAAERAD